LFLPSLSRQTQLGAYPQDYTLRAYRAEAAVCRGLPPPHLDPTIVVLRENKTSTLFPLPQVRTCMKCMQIIQKRAIRSTALHLNSIWALN